MGDSECYHDTLKDVTWDVSGPSGWWRIGEPWWTGCWWPAPPSPGILYLIRWVYSLMGPTRSWKHVPNGSSYVYDLNFRKQTQQHSESFGCWRASQVLFASCFPCRQLEWINFEPCLAQLSFPRNLFVGILSLKIVSKMLSNSWFFLIWTALNYH